MTVEEKKNIVFVSLERSKVFGELLKGTQVYMYRSDMDTMVPVAPRFLLMAQQRLNDPYTFFFLKKEEAIE